MDPRSKYVLATRILIERCARKMMLGTHNNVEWRSPVKMDALQWSDDLQAVLGTPLRAAMLHFCSA